LLIGTVVRQVDDVMHIQYGVSRTACHAFIAIAATNAAGYIDPVSRVIG